MFLVSIPMFFYMWKMIMILLDSSNNRISKIWSLGVSKWSQNWSKIGKMGIFHSIKALMIIFVPIPIFYPRESIFDTFKHLQKLLTHNFGSRGIKMAAKIGKMGENELFSKLLEIQ